jgi:hypothetical protein
MSFQGLVNGVNQGLGVEWLPQERYSARTYSARAVRLLSKGCDENNGGKVSLLHQTLLQLDTIHPRHPHIDNEATRVIYERRLQERFAGSKRVDQESMQSQQSLRCHPNRLVIVDD